MDTTTNSMLDRLIHWSLHHRLLVLALSGALLLGGTWSAMQMPVDVFPDLTAPTVTVVAESHGLAPEEVETLVTVPIETAMNGATGVRRVRSSTATGIAVIWVEFEWGTDVYRARQMVNEKLQLAQAQLPPGLPLPVLAPITSIMGEIMFIGLKGDVHTSPMAVRSAADWQVRRRLLAVPGVAQVIPIGGDVRQYQVLVDPIKLQARGIALSDVMEALQHANRNASGGLVVEGGQEYLLRGIGRFNHLQDIGMTVVKMAGTTPILIRDLADVTIGPALKRGEGGINGLPAVVMAISKQPDANTLELTKRVDAALDEIQTGLPAGIQIDRQNFRQADFIDRAVTNVEHALRDGAILVVIILIAFLLNWRATFISLLAIPLSLLVALLTLRILGGTINTMTLGGLTIAVGALVDDAIIDVENIFRRLRENQLLPANERRPALQVIYDASREVRGAIFFATLIIMLVFLPLFFLSGVESRLLQPLGLSYLVAIFASLVVALTVTPVACYYLLGQSGIRLPERESRLVAWLKSRYEPFLSRALRSPRLVIGLSGSLLILALLAVPFMGRSFLPEFNEGALTISGTLLPGTSLERSSELGRRLEQILLQFPETISTSRRTGRAELDEHAQGPHATEIEMTFRLKDRSKELFLQELREAVSVLPMSVTFGGPLAHRIDHMISGTRSGIAIKLFGDDLDTLRRLGKQVEAAIRPVRGVADLAVEQQIKIPQLAIRYNHAALAQYGFTSGQVGDAIDTAFQGDVVSKVIEGQKGYDLVVKYPDHVRADREAIANTLIATPAGGMVPLKALASIGMERGPNTISRENAQRKLVVSANVAGRDLAGTVDHIRRQIAQQVTLPDGYYLSIGGQIESANSSATLLGWLTLGVVVGIFLLLVTALGTWSAALVVMANLPLALIGGVVAVWLSGGVLSIASLVGFITLFGIATRNGLMMISHYHHLMMHDGLALEPAILRGSMERLSPILMTALTAGLALIPLVIRGSQPGNELQAPMASVILGGLLTSTFLNMVVIPVLFRRYGQPHSLAGTSK